VLDTFLTILKVFVLIAFLVDLYQFEKTKDISFGVYAIITFMALK
jgi:hypothetical protein